MGFEIIHIIDSIANPSAGTSYSVPSLCRALSNQGNSVTIMSIGERNTNGSRNGFRVQTWSQDYSRVPILRRLRFCRDLDSELSSRANRNVILHVHGLWLMANFYP